MKIDDIFRLYSHIIRGKEGITANEKNLREFFIRESFSPFTYDSYQVIMDDLFRILEILEYINQEKDKPTEIGAWLQILDAYTNQYPKYAIVNYLYVHNWDNEVELILFLKALTRYVYYQGSTTTVKFEIYNIIKQVSQKNSIDSYYKTDISIEYFNSFGRLKKGFALLAHYLIEPKAIPSYSIDKLIDPKDFVSIKSQWMINDDYSNIDNLGNMIILDIPKKIQAWDKKMEYYRRSNIESLKDILRDGMLSYDQFCERDTHLKNILCDFFRGSRL